MEMRSCLWNSHSNSKDRILPQGTTSAPKYSRIVLLKDREREKETQWERIRSSGEGFGPEEFMDGKRRKKGKIWQ